MSFWFDNFLSFQVELYNFAYWESHNHNIAEYEFCPINKTSGFILLNLIHSPQHNDNAIWNAMLPQKRATQFCVFGGCPTTTSRYDCADFIIFPAITFYKKLYTVLLLGGMPASAHWSGSGSNAAWRSVYVLYYMYCTTCSVCVCDTKHVIFHTYL